MRITLVTAFCALATGCVTTAPSPQVVTDPVPPLANAIVPLFMNWALEQEPLPRQPEGRHYRCRNMTGALQRLRDREQDSIYLVWNIKGDEGPERYRWKYLLDSRQTVTISPQERNRIAQLWHTGKLHLSTASFRTHATDNPSVIGVDFSIMGAAGCSVELIWSGPEFPVVVDPDSKMFTFVI